MFNYRDLTIVPKDNDTSIVIACDTVASYGMKSNDTFYCTNILLAACCMRVTLMECLSLNATPTLSINLFGVEMNPTGMELLEGIKQELSKAGYPNLLMNGSTEENIVTSSTSVGITLLSEVKNSELLFKKAVKGDYIVHIGQPYLGQEVVDNFNKMVSYRDIERLKSFGKDIKEICPVGSKGALYEAKEIAEHNQLMFKLNSDISSDNEILFKSAGPASTILVVASEHILEKIKNDFENSLILGSLLER